MVIIELSQACNLARVGRVFSGGALTDERRKSPWGSYSPSVRAPGALTERLHSARGTSKLALVQTTL